jgi:hypothetical protein
MSDERYPRGTAFHEAGHAIVAWSFGLRVERISVLRDDASGSTQTEPADHLRLVEQIAVWAAGYTAENTFGYRTHDLAAFSDHNRIHILLQDNGIEEGPKAEALRLQGAECARSRLQAHNLKVIRLAERLMRVGFVDAAEFLQLMEENES